jgi:hypothetical protein
MYKKILILILIFAFLICEVNCTAWTPLISDDFETDLSKWTVTTPSFTRSTTQKQSGSYSGKLMRESSNSPLAYMNFTPIIDVMKIDFWIFIDDTGLGTGEAFYTNVRYDSTQILYVMWHNNHNIVWFDGVNTHNTGLTYTGLTWYHVVIYIDIVDKHTEFYLNDANATSFGFQNLPTLINRFVPTAYVYDANPKMYLDNVQILIPSSAPPETPSGTKIHMTNNYPVFFFAGFCIFVSIIILIYHDDIEKSREKRRL